MRHALGYSMVELFVGVNGRYDFILFESVGYRMDQYILVAWLATYLRVWFCWLVVDGLNLVHSWLLLLV
jgi:hypothetical protein